MVYERWMVQRAMDTLYEKSGLVCFVRTDSCHNKSRTFYKCPAREMKSLSHGHFHWNIDGGC